MNFRTKLLGLAGAVMAFSGMAYGQTCLGGATEASAANFVRAEGSTELLPQITITCAAGGAAVVAGSTANITVYISPAVTVTSAVTNAPATGQTEAIATSNGGAGSGSIFGTVSGSSVTFSGIPITATTTTFTINNIRVNATVIPTTVGQPPTAISAQSFVSGANVTPGPTAVVPVAYALNGLTPVKEWELPGRTTSNAVNVGGPGAAAVKVTSFGVCGGINTGSGVGSSNPNFFISVDEGFQNAFKTQPDESLATSGGAAVAPDPANTNSGTRIAVTFTNVPAGLGIYLPLTVASTTAAVAPALVPTTFTAIISPTAPTGAGNVQIAATTPNAVSGLGLYSVPVSNGTATAWYEVTADNGLQTVDPMTIPVTLVAPTNLIAIQTANLTVSTSFAPIGSSPIPSFAQGSSTVPLGVLGFTSCTTTLLFPFVTNTSGFDTGIAIANTTADPFGTKAQSGTCKLNWYGSGTVVAGNATDITGNSTIASGTTLAFDLPTELALNAANPATFQGYIIAQCGFVNAHGFAYITYAFPGSSSDTMGYLAIVLARGTTALEGDQF